MWRLGIVVCLVGCGEPSTPPADDPPDAAATVDVAVDPDAAPPIATFRNPLNTGADPFLTMHDGHYYLMTTQGDALRMWTATSLAELAVAPPQTIWTDTDPSRNRDIWAPSLYTFNGKWYAYYTADDGIDEHHRNYVLEADDPLGPYHWKAKLEATNAHDLWAIDPDILVQNGNMYLVWSGAGAEGHNMIYIAPMSNPWTVSGARTYLPSSGGCGEVREAPAILQHDDRTFLVYSTCDTGKPDYQLWMHSIPQTADPLVASNWDQMSSAVFARNDAAGVWGPGSNSFFKSPDGTEDWIAYHAKNTTQFTYDMRTTRAQRIAWDSAGAPIFGQPLAIGATQDVPSGDPGHGSYFLDDAGPSSGPGGVTFSEGWTAYPNCGNQCFEGNDHGATQTDATATWTFTGTQIALYSVRDAGNGIAAMSIDGGDEVMIDYYARIRQGEHPVYTSPKLPFGEHALRVRVTGNRAGASAGTAISIDRAEVFTH